MHSTIPKHDYSISSAIQLIRDKIISITRECCFSDIQNVLGTQVKDQKTRRQLTAAGFLVITQQ